MEKADEATPGDVATYYDSVAGDWDRTVGAERHNRHFATEFAAELDRLTGPVAGAGSVLEMGAGTGVQSVRLAPRFGHLTATDFSANMLDVLTRRVRQEGLDNVTVLQLDACDMAGIQDRTFDAAYSIGLLETIPDLSVHFAECHRVLKPGGRVFGITSNGDCPWYALQRRLAGSAGHCRRDALCTASDLRRAAADAGFADMQTLAWGAVPPTLREGAIAAALARVGAVAGRTPLRRFLGVLSFSAVKPSGQAG